MTPIALLQPGMELNNDVHDESGRLLAKAETILTDKHIKVLKTWGVSHAIVKDENTLEKQAETAIELSPAALEQAEEVADYLFGLSNREHPAIQQLFKISVQRIATALSTPKG